VLYLGPSTVLSDPDQPLWVVRLVSELFQAVLALFLAWRLH
jgi:hypothetical protein